MRPGKWPYAVISTLAVAAVALLGWQHRAANELRGEIARQRTQARERTRLQAENQRLVAAQPTAEELADVIARRMAQEQLRSQLAAMHRREEAARAGATLRGVADPNAAVPSLKGNLLAAERWINAGQATPEAAFQTTLWASAAGDLDSLAELLAFDVEARSQATATFDRLPAAVQNELGTPERLIALLTAMDVPLGRASILGQFPSPTGTKVSALLIDAAGKSKTTLFTLRAEGDRWRLVVPAAVVKRYADWLQPPGAAAGGRVN
jgi:hypothetical protein